MKRKGDSLFFSLLVGTFLLASFFVLQKTQADSIDVRINEVYPNPESGEEEFIEIKNFGGEVNLKGWLIKDAGNHKFEIEEDLTLSPGEIKAWERNFFLNNSGFEAVYLLNSKEEEIDGTSFENAQPYQGFSWNLWDDNWQWSLPTFGEENEESPTEDNKGEDDEKNENQEESPEYSEEIRLNEILPNPSGEESQEEYIEIYNYSKEAIDLSGWILKDSSKTGLYVLPDGLNIKSKSFLTIYREDFGFALNNTGESAYLLNPDEKIVSEISFSESAKEDVSFNFFQDDSWRWSSQLTPGEANQFDEFPAFSVSLPNKIYRNVYADFEVEIDDEETRVKWDFGDGKTSTQRKARHKYEENEDYKITLTLSGKSESIEKEYEIEVEKFENDDMELIALLPNPEGSDTDGEWIELKNNGKKKIDLKNWSLATGNSNLYNHPINEKFIIKGGGSEKIYRNNCSFSLGNQTGKVELRYPDGKVSDEVEYAKEKIEEGEIYLKVGKKWIWQNEKEEDAPQKNASIKAVIQEPTFQNEQEPEIRDSLDFIGKFSQDESKKMNKIVYFLGNSFSISKSIENQLIKNKVSLEKTSRFYSFNQHLEKNFWLLTLLTKFNELLNKIF